jgi:hypothetical protein
MQSGRMTPGATVSNFTALWAAQELSSIRKYFRSRLLLAFLNTYGKLDPTRIPDYLSDAALVLTTGMATRINSVMEAIETLQSKSTQKPEISLYQSNVSGAILWQLRDNTLTQAIYEQRSKGVVSITTINQIIWIRQVAANSNVNIDDV